jgi:hypothetical protein
MTWQIVVLVLGFFAWVGWNSYLNVLKARTEVAKESLKQSAYELGHKYAYETDEAFAPRNGDIE